MPPRLGGLAAAADPDAAAGWDNSEAGCCVAGAVAGGGVPIGRLLAGRWGAIGTGGLPVTAASG
ncbi:MAG TPA: hypothetical protein VMB77_01405 [Syntrophales bacterium]|nr:hypothetical protein [Syntrophales bacterium]